MVAVMEPTTIQDVVLKVSMLIDEANKNWSIKKNKRSRTVSAFAMTLVNFGADYSFVSTTFIPLLGIEPSVLGFSYEIEIASGKLVEIDK
ncbi:hypothetical protein Tco_0406528, partial [Tanacetum coccineum]